MNSTDRRVMSRILLVDSDLSVCTAISRTLAGLGYGLDVAYDCSEARRLSDQHRYAIGLFGERLSDGDGVGLFTEMHRQQADMSGLLVTNVPNLNSVSKAIGAGMSRVLATPLDYQELLEFIAAAPESAAQSPPAAAPPARADQSAAAPPAAAAPAPLRRFDPDRPQGDYSEDAIAELSASDIAQRLSIGDLAAVIRSVEYPFAGKERLEYFDRDTLERVVHLVRRWCRNRLQRHTW